MEAKRATFPHSLLAIPKENKRIVLGFTVEENELEEKTDTGTFIKRVDLNSVEIRISGVPEEIPPRIFLLYETVNESFDSMGFKEGDAVRFIYSKNIENKLIIADIEKMNDAPLE
jgi:Cu/Ag efflux protein CusF